MTARLHTDLPHNSARFPHWAPMLGALSIPYVDPAELSAVEPSVPGSPEADLASREPIPEVLVGVTTAGLSGALTGGLASGNWRGVAIGSSASAAAWSLFTLLNAWRQLGKATKGILGTVAVTGASVAVSLVVKRSRRQR